MPTSVQNFYRKYTFTCHECGQPFHPCHKKQRTCSKSCAMRLGQRSRRQRASKDIVPLTIGSTSVVVHLSQGKHSIVDLADWADVSRFSWFYHSDGSAARGEKYRGNDGRNRNRIIRLHQHLMPLSNGLEPDHRDLDRLNNRRLNLRPATSSEQKMNQGVKCNNTSGFKGVAWDKRRHKWIAFVRANGVRVTIGRFKRKVNAIICRKAVAKFVHGEFYRETA